jgi:hypothetical protein
LLSRDKQKNEQIGSAGKFRISLERFRKFLAFVSDDFNATIRRRKMNLEFVDDAISSGSRKTNSLAIITDPINAC